MLKNERIINYMVGLAGKENDHHRSLTGIQMNFWPLVHPWEPVEELKDVIFASHLLCCFVGSLCCSTDMVRKC